MYVDVLPGVVILMLGCLHGKVVVGHRAKACSLTMTPVSNYNALRAYCMLAVDLARQCSKCELGSDRFVWEGLNYRMLAEHGHLPCDA